MSLEVCLIIVFFFFFFFFFFLIFFPQVIGKDLFRVVREKWGANLDSFISEKVIAVPGDVSYENLGVNDSKRRQDMWKEIDIILNSAATTSFDER
jgi:fatty acyl-CoA reductase